MLKKEKKTNIIFVNDDAIMNLKPGSLSLDRRVAIEIIPENCVIETYSTSEHSAIKVIKAMRKYCCCFRVEVDLEGCVFDASYVLRNPETMEYCDKKHTYTKIPYPFNSFSEAVCKTALIAVEDFKETFVPTKGETR